LQGNLVPNRSAQHRIARFERVKNGTKGMRFPDFELNILLDTSKRAQVKRK
jgi:hypothetical protein